MKKILSLLAFLTLALGMHSTGSAQEHLTGSAQESTQTENPKEDSQIQQKFAGQISQCYFGTHDYWQLEQLCNEKADSICDPLLAWGRGMAAARFLQLEDAKKHLGKFIYEYRDELPASWTLYAADVLASSLFWLQEYDEAAKVMEMALQVISEEGIADKHQGAIVRFTESRDRNLELAKHPKMTLTCSGSDIRIPFRITTFGKGFEKNRLMTIEGSMHSIRQAHDKLGSAQVQGKPVSMIFDTGCGQNMITKQMAEELHLKPINAGVIIDGSDESDASFVMADSLQMGNATLRNVIFTSIDTNNDELSQVASIIIGMPVMMQMRQFTMDFKKKVITSPSQPTDYPSKNFSFDIEGGTIHLRIHRNNKPIKMMLDTGNGHLSHLDYQFYTENQEELDRCKEASVTSMGVGGVFEKKYALVKNFKFMLNDKQYRFPLLMVMKDKMDAALGENNMGFPFLSSFKRVTISLKDAHIEFE